jgi:hypothetical protein
MLLKMLLCRGSSFDCLEKASEDSSRDKTIVKKFNGENPAEWFPIRKIDEDWLNSIGCLELVPPGVKSHGTLNAIGGGTSNMMMHNGLSTSFGVGGIAVTSITQHNGIIGNASMKTPNPPRVRPSSTGTG